MGNASNEYLRNAVLTAPPEQLHLMLYDGAIRFARQGITGIDEKNWEMAFNGFSRAQRIVLEMLNSLNHEADRNLCVRMAGLYNFIYRRLVDACASRSTASALEALKILEYQRETWVLLIERLREEQPAPSPSSGRPAARGDSLDEVHGSLCVEG